ncbi:right-handed parallel beta-helix repeat-containing protein [Lentisphaera profundi]|uniref:Right-handed parallel beta-helix repeat-containing protein n=1 Tax=Lentisphaera profundi TaxID=1658616 RepID=A0ABY7VQF5_9BACT|nr:right-handed parallel beta-helix repeat-containing protein [Lentisphaera profundi]WDE95438.1 right-handed parallel beta-helix repeat-containing protein [Lentisphaera profundi]
MNKIFYLLIFCTCLIQAKEIHAYPNNIKSNLRVAHQQWQKLRQDKYSGTIEIILHPGIHRLSETLIFNEIGAESKTIIRSKNSAPAIISGSRKIEDWQQTKLKNGKIWSASVPWAKDTHFFHVLFKNDKMLKRSSSEMIELSNDAPSRFYCNTLQSRLEFNNHPEITALKNFDDVELFGQPTRKWLVNYLPIESIKKDKTTLKIPATYIMSGEWKIENSLEYLDTPGEWCLNNGTLYYWPEATKPKDIFAPYLDELIRVAGQSDASLKGEKEKPASNFIFQNLTFTHADRQSWSKDDIGLQHDWNMWDKANGLLRFRSAKNCEVRKCNFINSGSDGIRLDLFCQNIKIHDNYFSKLGGTGILLAGYGPGKKDVNHHNEIVNNTLTDIGTLFWHSPGIFIWQSGHNLIAKNHIYDQGYSGIIVAGVRRRFFEQKFPKDQRTDKNPFKFWQFPKGTREHLPSIRWAEIKNIKDPLDWKLYEPYMHARHNVIEFNEVHDCMKRLHDGNGIYLSAHGNENLVRYNLVYNHPKGSMIRTDDDSHQSLLSFNVLLGTTAKDGLCMKGQNTFENNFFFNTRFTTGMAGNKAEYTSNFRKNIFYSTGDINHFHYKTFMMGPMLNDNIYYSPNTENARKFLRDVQTLGQDSRSLVADPQFTELDTGDLSFLPDSPAHKMGIRGLNKEQFLNIGTSQDPWLKRKQSQLPIKWNDMQGDYYYYINKIKRIH